jgi:hypothetical protein
MVLPLHLPLSLLIGKSSERPAAVKGARLSLCKTGGNHQRKYRPFNELQMLSPGLTGAEQESEQEKSKKGASSAPPWMDLTLIWSRILILIWSDPDKLGEDLARQDVLLAFAHVGSDLRADLDRHYLTEAIGSARLFETLHEALTAMHHAK